MMLNRLLLVALLGAHFCYASAQLTTTCLAEVEGKSERARPNVLLIITDDQGYGDVGFHGNEMIQTPNLDQLAKSSLRLTNFHVEPTCAETRSALISGQFPLKVGVWHTIMGRSIMQADTLTMPQVFREAGYRTGMFGKWHLGDNFPYRPEDRGFDVTLNHGGGGVGQTPDVWGNDYFDDVYLANGQLQPVRGYCTDVFFNAATEFISQSSERPFFCYLSTNAPHGPYRVPERYKQAYLDKGVPEPMASFYGMITNIDENLGQLMQVLQRQELDRETIVVFMTDNGTAAGVHRGDRDGWKGFNAGMRGTKGQQYDGGHRVPCFIRFPDGQHADREVSALTAHVDLLPTLASACGLSIAEDDARELDGVNLLPIIEAPQTLSDRSLVVQSHRVEVPTQWRKSAVMTQRWRLIDGEQLYDIQADPGQRDDVAEEFPQVVDRLRRKYLQWWDYCQPNADRYSRIPLGNPQAERTLLTAHDWHGPRPPWNQNMIERAPATNGAWEITVERGGTYQFLLANRPLAEPRAIGCDKAMLRIGTQAKTIEMDAQARLAPISMNLEPGDYRLTTRLIDRDQPEENRGAYYIYANYLGKAAEATQLPDWLHPGDRIAIVGGTLIERVQEFGWLQAELLARTPQAGLTICNLGWSGDDVRGRARAVFGQVPDGKQRRLDDLELAGANVVVLAYGMSESLSQQLSEEDFKNELVNLVRSQKQAGRRVVLATIPKLITKAAGDLDATAASDKKHEDQRAATTQVGAGIDWKSIVGRYERRRTVLNSVIEQVASDSSSVTATIELPSIDTGWFDAASNLSGDGYAEWCRRLAKGLFPDAASPSQSKIEHLAKLSREANRVFFEMHRPQNETYLYLFRKHEQGNNGVEPPQNRPLLERLQWELLHTAALAN